MIVTVSNGAVLDTATMEFADQTVVLEGDRIVDLVDGGSGSSKTAADLDIDARGQYVLPGFIDAHVHHYIVTMDFHRLMAMTDVERGIAMARLAEGNVRRGFTTVRDTGGDVRGLMRAIRSGTCGGPRIVTAGHMLSQTGGHGDMRAARDATSECGCQIYGDAAAYVVDGADACRKAARQVLREGSDFVKIMSSGGVASPSDPFDSVQYTPEEIRAITTETDHRHTYTTAHAYLPDAIRQAVDNGVTCIEHGNGIDAAIASHLAELGVIMVPTLVTYQAMQELGAKMGLPQVNLDKNTGVFEMGLRSIEIAKEAGIELGLGTDLLGDAQSWQNRELAIRADLEPAVDVLRSMFVTNAKLCRLEGQIGVLQPGAYADLVVSRVNPLERLAALAEPEATISTVIQHGEPVGAAR